MHDTIGLGGEDTGIILVRNNLSDSTKGGDILLYLQSEKTPRNLVLQNNTLLCGKLLFDQELPKAMTIRNNILKQDLLLKKPELWNRTGIAKHFLVDHNCYLKRFGGKDAPPMMPSDLAADPQFLSQNPSDPNYYLRLPANSPLATKGAGGDLPAYIGALPPGPAPKEGDWFTRKLAKWKHLREPGVATDAAQPFVVSNKKDKTGKAFKTLAEAVAGSTNGDTIEIRGNGPFETPAITIGKKSLVIRAGARYRPLIRYQAGVLKNEEMLRTEGSLVLEGLQIQLRRPDAKDGAGSVAAVYSKKAPLHLANCGFDIHGEASFAVNSMECPLAEIRNCALISSSYLGLASTPKCEFRFKNNVAVGRVFLSLHLPESKVRKVSVQLSENSIRAGTVIGLNVLAFPEPGAPWLTLNASGNVIDASYSVANVNLQWPSLDAKTLSSASETESLVRRIMAWKDQSNVYRPNLNDFFSFAGKERIIQPAKLRRTLADWHEFWRLEDTGNLQGKILFAGGDLRSRSVQAPEKITVEDFRLLPGSTGKGAAKAGKDLGADLNLVGPGPAYERWQQTAEYQQWLQRSGQSK